MGTLEGKFALVTGASRGIGYHCAKALAQEGAHVIAVARTVGGLEDLDDEIRSLGGTSTLVPMDLLDYEAIDRLGASIHERWGKLDIAVLNAGILGGLSPIEHFEPKDFDKVLALNVTANWRLICSLSPLLRLPDAAHAIVMTASAAREAKPFWGAYSASQAALRSLALTWAAETEKTGLRVNLLDPGPTRTALRAQAMPGEDPATISDPSSIAASVLHLTSPQMTESGKTMAQATKSFIE